MNFEQAQRDITNWITGFVEKPNAKLNGWPPCPHARKARLDGQFEIRQGRVDPYTDLRHVEMGDKMVFAYVYEPDKFTAKEFNDQIQAVNAGFLVPRDIIALADHPDDKEEIMDVIMNQGTWTIAFVQPLSKLNHFAQLIAGRGYYNGWPEDYLKALFEFRKDPRR
jgi:hypothetical protein